jgi:hypothetical protein
MTSKRCEKNASSQPTRRLAAGHDQFSLALFTTNWNREDYLEVMRHAIALGFNTHRMLQQIRLESVFLTLDSAASSPLGGVRQMPANVVFRDDSVSVAGR